MITQAEIDYLAQKAQWHVDCDLKRNRGRYNPSHDSPVVITGDGVDDLDRLLSMMPLYPNGRFTIDVGRTESAYREVGITDIQALRTAYIAFWGTVSKPPPVEDNPR